MPLGVNHPGIVAHRGKVYVHGGYTDGGAETDALQRFDPATGDWTTLTPSGPPRAAETLAAVNGRLSRSAAPATAPRSPPSRSTASPPTAGEPAPA